MPLFVRESGAQKRPDQLVSEFDTDHPRTHHKHVHIVVFDALVGGIRVMAQAGADAGDLVGGHGSADARPAHNDASVSPARTDRVPDGRREIRVIHRCRAVCAAVQRFVGQATHKRKQSLFQFKTRMIRPKCDAHGSILLDERPDGGRGRSR
jgi:hypothetical protein